MRRCFLLGFQNIPVFFVNQTCKHNGWHGQRKQNDTEQTCPDIRSRIHRYPIEQQLRNTQHQPRCAQQTNIGFRPAMPFVFASDNLKTQYAGDSVYDPEGTHYQNHIRRDTPIPIPVLRHFSPKRAEGCHHISKKPNKELRIFSPMMAAKIQKISLPTAGCAFPLCLPLCRNTGLCADG